MVGITANRSCQEMKQSYNVIRILCNQLVMALTDM